MLDKTGTLFSHVKPSDTSFQGGGLRDFFLYRDLGVAQATHGKVVAHLVKADPLPAPTQRVSTQIGMVDTFV